MRKNIDKMLAQEKIEINKFMEDLLRIIEMQSKILEMEIDAEDGGYFIEDF